MKKHNITPTIFELREKVAADGGYLALAPNACRVLDRIGAYGRIRTQGFSYEEMTFLSGRNLSRIGSVFNGHQQKYGYKALRVQRGIVRRTLLDMTSESGIEIRYGMKCMSIEEIPEKSNVTVRFASGESETADLVIGADGIHSRVRNTISPSTIPRFSGQMGLGGPVARSRLQSSADGLPFPAMILGQDNSFAMMPCTYTGDILGVFATVEANDRSREEWTNFGADKQHLANVFHDRHSEATDWPEVVKTAAREVDVENLTLWPFYKVPILDQWSSQSGRVVLIGDAAHGIPPTGGQGAAMAFEDAATLAELIVAGQSGLKERLDGWEKRRKERVERVVAFTSRSGDSRKASSSTFQLIIKEWLMWAFFLVKGKDMGLAWMYEYDTEKHA